MAHSAVVVTAAVVVPTAISYEIRAPHRSVVDVGAYVVICADYHFARSPIGATRRLAKVRVQSDFTHS